MSEDREPYIVLGQEVEPEVQAARLDADGTWRNYPPDPSDLAVIERRHLDRIIELLAAAYGYLDYDQKDEAMKTLEAVLTALTERTWSTL